MKLKKKWIDKFRKQRQTLLRAAITGERNCPKERKWSHEKSIKNCNCISQLKVKMCVLSDGSTYHGESLHGKAHGKGEWQSADGDCYVGDFCEGAFHGHGRYTDVAGNVYVGAFQRGAYEGVGTYMASDGRAAVSCYAAGDHVGEGMGWSTARNQAWRLHNGKVVVEVSLAEASQFASTLGLQMPDSVYKIPADGYRQWSEKLLHVDGCTHAASLEFTMDGYIPAVSLDGERRGFMMAHSRHALVDMEMCDALVAECEARARAMGGWTSRRHENYPTTDLPIQRMPVALAWFCGSFLPSSALPFLAHAFAFTLPREVCLSLCVSDAFVVKYDADAGQRFLKPHRDGQGHQGSATILSFNVALNGLDEYEGGGTYFRRLDGSPEHPEGSIRLPKGHLLAHASGLVHGGHPITSGVRYILVVFVTVEAAYSDWSYSFYTYVRSTVDPDECH